MNSTVTNEERGSCRSKSTYHGTRRGDKQTSGQLDDTTMDDDDEVGLSPETLQALMEFRLEADRKAATVSSGEELPSEDFGMSQFWWDDSTSELLGREAIETPLPGESRSENFGESDRKPRRIGILSAPSMFFGIQRLVQNGCLHGLAAKSDEIVLMEFDPRFEAACGKGRFFRFDFNQLNFLPNELLGTFDYLFAGPPYVSMACVDEYIKAFDLLAKSEHTPRAIAIGATLEEPLAAHGYVLVEDVELRYKSKFCTPVRLFRKYSCAAVATNIASTGDAHASPPEQAPLPLPPSRS